MGLIVAWIASNKGHSFLGWFIYGALLWPIALIHIAFASNKGRKCVKCFSNIDIRASVCPHCKHKITAEELKNYNESKQKGQNTKYIAIAVIVGLLFISFTLVKKSTDSYLKESQVVKDATSTDQIGSKVPYSVVSLGSFNYIILDQKYIN